MNLKKKLAVVSTHPIQYQVPLFKKLKKEGLDIDVFYASNHGFKSKFKDKEFNKKFNWNIDLLKGYKSYFSKNQNQAIDSWRLSFDSLEIFFKKKKYDALLFFGWSNILFLKAFYIAKKFQIPTILRVETNFHSKIRIIKKIIKYFILKILFKYIDYFLYIGKLNREFYIKLGVKNSKLFNAPYFVDNNFFKKNSKKKIKKNVKNCLFVGKLIKRKNPLLFLKVANYFKNDKSLHFTLVGDGELLKSCKEYIKYKKLKNVSILGFKNQKELVDIYKNSDLLLVTSEYETWGLVINEAMASGIPVIASNNCGASFDLISKKTGFIYKNEKDLIKKILKISKSRKLENSMKKNVIKKVKDYSINKTVLSIKKILYKL